MAEKVMVFETPDYKHRVSFSERGFTPNTPDACAIGVRNWVVWTANHLIIEVKSTLNIPLEALEAEAHNVENKSFDSFVDGVCNRIAAGFDERVTVYNRYR